MRITIRIFSVATLAIAAVLPLAGCDDPCADLSDRCDRCEGNDEDLCTRLVDSYDYEACEDALATDLCQAPQDSDDGGEPASGGGGSDGGSGGDGGGS